MTKRTKISKGEQIIVATLINLNVEFSHEHKFDDCRNNKPLPFDFYLPQWNTLIEFDGEHHFRFKSFWNKGRTSLELTQKNDRLKNRYCKTKGLKLIRIPFKMVDKIETIIFREHKKGFVRNLNLSKKLIKRKPKAINVVPETISIPHNSGIKLLNEEAEIDMIIYFLKTANKKYAQRFDFTFDIYNRFGETTYKMYDKYTGEVFCNGMSIYVTTMIKDAYNTEDYNYMIDIFEYCLDYENIIIKNMIKTVAGLLYMTDK